MGSVTDIDLRHIVPRRGSKREAFEELCCQLARRTIPANSTYVRLHGAGGDGGVECFADTSNGDRIGWQAKYVFDIKSLIPQATRSITAALNTHSRLRRYVISFPFDLTGPTSRRGTSSSQTLANWQRKFEQQARASGRELVIEIWPASQIQSLLLEHDSSGGIREYFFNGTVLTDDWFSEHLDSAEATAGPRYSDPNVQTRLWNWFSAFGRTSEWSDALTDKLRKCWDARDRLSTSLLEPRVDAALPPWPETVRPDAQSATSEIDSFLAKCDRLVSSSEKELYRQCVGDLDTVLDRLSDIESRLVSAIESEHGGGTANAPGFRQFMAEWQVSFPTANLDDTRNMIAGLEDTRDWLRSPACLLAYKSMFILHGAPGVGKTHGVCDAARRRFGNGLPTCVLFGHEFRSEPDPWTRFAESLGLPLTLGRNAVLDALNAAAEAAGRPLIVCIDAINETRPFRYWRDRIATFSNAFQRRPYLRVMFTCKTSYLNVCLPETHEMPVFEHVGFADVQRTACQTFFQHYGLAPPIAPILQAELSNPLYLRLMCETLKSLGLTRVPIGWNGLAPTIRAFLWEKEKQFSIEHGTNEGARIVAGSLRTVARQFADSADSLLTFSQAQKAILQAKPNAANLPVLEWLVREDLLIEDAPNSQSAFDEESTIRPAFDRLGDFLVALELLEGCDGDGLRIACQPGGLLHSLWRDGDTLSRYHGVIAALSVLIPERESGVELPYLTDDEALHETLSQIAIGSFPAREPSSFSATSVSLLETALGRHDRFAEAMDAVLPVAWQASPIDALWLSRVLKSQPIAKRDALWCKYLHDRFDSHGPVRRLIEAAHESPLDDIDADSLERWCVALLWFAAAADRRVKDGATRAATAILAAQSQSVPSVLQMFTSCDDDEVKERALLSCYGALILSRDADVLPTVASILQNAYLEDPTTFDNALIRDHIRSIFEFARELDVLPDGIALDLTMQPIPSEWPTALPSEEQAKSWGRLLRFAPNEFFSDFFKYSMNCLRPWEHAFSRVDMAKWILQRIVCGFSYPGSGCEAYDSEMVATYGGERGKPVWAERIGKKYMWIAMYQLASRLHDHVGERVDEWDVEPQQRLSIILEERKLDPTLPMKVAPTERRADVWWINAAARISLTDACSDNEWVAKDRDVPTLDEFLTVVTENGQDWRVLVSYPSWGDHDQETGESPEYRNVWMNVRAFLVRKDDAIAVWKSLHRRNLFDRRMPEGTDWYHGFVGEYPWGTPFNMEPDEWSGAGQHAVTLPALCQPSWNRLIAGWEYDATLSPGVSMLVPDRTLFTPKEIWWNGRDGYRGADGRTVFRDPSLAEGGPQTLLADPVDFQGRLEELGLGLLWTLVGEKRILGSRDGQSTPMRTFSQLARLNENGSVHAGELVFFDDYSQYTGPAEK